MLPALRLLLVIELLSESTVPIDKLPYTEEFERLYRLYIARLGMPVTKAEMWWDFLTARKQGFDESPDRRSGVKRRPIPKTRLRVAAQLLAKCPSVDRLPYTPEFETIYQAFLALINGPLERDEAWRILLSARKRGRRRCA